MTGILPPEGRRASTAIGTNSSTVIVANPSIFVAIVKGLYRLCKFGVKTFPPDPNGGMLKKMKGYPHRRVHRRAVDLFPGGCAGSEDTLIQRAPSRVARALVITFVLTLLAATLSTTRSSARAADADADAPTTRPVNRRARHVIVISIDGARPDVMLRADMPNVRSQMRRGAFTFYAVTTPAAVTLPSHTSMMTGVTIERHGIDFNDDVGAHKKASPKAWTLFEIAHDAGLSTALVAGKSKFSILAKHGTVDCLWVPIESVVADDIVARRAAAVIREQKPEAMLIHFGNNDTVGHAVGWGTPQQIDAIELADKAVGVVLKAVDDAGMTGSTLIIVSSDHGGTGRVHGGLDARSRYIPWIVAGPGVRKDFDLTRFTDLSIHTEDTFATACAALGLTVPLEPDGKPADGKPVDQIYDRNQLLTADVPPTPPTPPADAASNRRSAGKDQVSPAAPKLETPKLDTPKLDTPVPATRPEGD